MVVTRLHEFSNTFCRSMTIENDPRMFTIKMDKYIQLYLSGVVWSNVSKVKDKIDADASMAVRLPLPGQHKDGV